MDQEGDPVRAGGRNKNRRSPDLVWDTAWYYYHKIGFSDESIILRRLFRDDEDADFKRYYDPERKQEVVGDDNFKLGYGWFSRAVALVDSGVRESGVQGGTAGTIQYVDPAPQRKGRPDDIAFRSMPAHAQTRYAAGAGEDEHVRHPGPVRRAGQERMGLRAQRMGQVRRARLHVAQRGPRQGRQDAPRPGPARRFHRPERSSSR